MRTNENNNYHNNNENNKNNGNSNSVVSCFQMEVLLRFIDRPFWNRQMLMESNNLYRKNSDLRHISVMVCQFIVDV